MSNYREAFSHFRNETWSVVCCSAIYMQSNATPYRMGTCLHVHVEHLTTLATLDMLTFKDKQLASIYCGMVSQRCACFERGMASTPAYNGSGVSAAGQHMPPS